LTTKASETWKMEGVAPSVCSGGNEGKKKKAAPDASLLKLSACGN